MPPQPPALAQIASWAAPPCHIQAAQRFGDVTEKVAPVRRGRPLMTSLGHHVQDAGDDLNASLVPRARIVRRLGDIGSRRAR